MAIKLNLPIAIENAIGCTLEDGTPVTYVQVRFHEGKDKIAGLIPAAAILFDSYVTHPINAPKSVKLLDAFMGPGYWEGSAPVDDKGKVIKPSKSGNRLLVIAGINLNRLSWTDEHGGSCDIVVVDGPVAQALLGVLPEKKRDSATLAKLDEEPKVPFSLKKNKLVSKKTAIPNGLKELSKEK